MTRFKTIIFVLAILSNNILYSQDAREPQVAASSASFSVDSDDLGSVANSVNLFTGEVALPMTLISLPGRGGLNAGVSISYSSAGVRQQATTWNLEAPTGPVGMGWSLDYPKIMVDHKETGTIEDDEYYLLDGGASNRLYRGEGNGTFREYHTANYNFWKIVYTPGSETWEITKEDGTKYTYGDKSSNRNTVQWAINWANWIGNSNRTSGQTQHALVWNLSEVENTWGDAITYEYVLEENFVGSSSGKKQTEACYLSAITTPDGGQVKLNYNIKLGDEYMEPHTEQAEPDAYQERYEKKYLDNIEVWSNFGMKLRTVRLGYSFVGSGNLTKRVLSKVIPEDTQGQSLPGMQFEYLNSGTSIGCLSKVINSWGGWVNFTYSAGITVSNSSRNLTISAPSGYAEPNVWQGPDYVVVSWRQLNGGNHEDGNRNLQLKAYQWEGEWMEKHLDTISNVRHNAPDILDINWSNPYYKMDDFQLGTSKNFFAVLKKRYSGNYYDLYLYHKSDLERGEWISTSYALNIDPGHTLDDAHNGPTLLVGENFVAVHTYFDGDIFTYTWAGSTWNQETLTDLPDNRYSAASGNNWLVSHASSGNDVISFRFLDEQMKWLKKEVPEALDFESDALKKSYWYGANSYVMVMADGSEELMYRWDEQYNTFFKDTPWGSLPEDTLGVRIINNSMAAIAPTDDSGAKTSRFDGAFWKTTAMIQSYSPTTTSNYFSFGEDIVGYPYSNNNGRLKIFNPNTDVWATENSYTGTGYESQTTASAHYFGRNFRYRQPDGSFDFIHSVTPDANHAIKSGPTYAVYDKSGIARFVPIKNGDAHINDEITLTGSEIYRTNHGLWSAYKNQVGLSSIVLVPNTNSNNWEDQTQLKLHRLVNEEVSGDQVFYPVVLVETNDGEQSYYTSFDYDADDALDHATANPGGITAQFSMVRTIPGSNTTTSTPYGYTESYFFNGLPSDDSYATFPNLHNALTHYEKLLGMSYGSITFDSNDIEVASNDIFYKVFTKNISNGTKNVATVHYARPMISDQTVDGLSTRTTNTYDNNTAMLATTTTNDLSGNGEEVEVSYTYWWEQYDTDRSENILSGVIQQETEINNNLTNAQVTTWKNWNSTADAPWQTFRWKGTGAGTFSGWTSGTGGSDWVKTSQIDVRDTYGNVLETSNLAGLSNAVIMGYHHSVPVAQISNADYSTAKTALGGDTGINNLQTQDGSTLQTTLNALRTDNNLSDALVNTSTYHPLNGLITSVDPNGLESTNDFNDAFLLTSIKDDDDNIIAHSDYHFTLESSAPQLGVSSNDINPDEDAGNTVHTVTSNGAWTTTDHGSSWLSVTPASGTNNANITISYTENTSTESRQGTVTVTGQGLSEDIAIDQDETPVILTTSTHELVFYYPTTDLNFDITSNISWNMTWPPTYYDGYGWIYVTSTSGTGNQTITVSIANPGSGTWEAELTITGGGITRTVDIAFIN